MEAHTSNIGGEHVIDHTKHAFESGGDAGDYALIHEGRDRDRNVSDHDDETEGPGWNPSHSRANSTASTHPASYVAPPAVIVPPGHDVVYDDDYERNLAREGGADGRSRSVGSGSYDAGRVGFPEGDYAYTQAGR